MTDAAADTVPGPAVGSSPRRRRRDVAMVLAVVLLGAAVPVALHQADAATAFNCSAEYRVDEVMANGARWQLCWERRIREGIVLHDVVYTPVDGQPVEILGEAYLAQIHVPYDDNGARFHDVSDFGLGRLPSGGDVGIMNDLTPDDCPGGTLLQDEGVDVLCLTTAATGYAYKDYDAQAQSSSLNLFSVSHIGAYNYVVAWNLDDDGTIRPEVGATGTLQRYGNSNTPRTATWPMGGGRHAVAHMHNYYWRLDFDVAGTRLNDRFEEMQALPAVNRTQRRNTRQGFANEAARRVAPGGMRTWRVRDGAERNADNHWLSLELLPDTDHIFRGPTWERFTQNEVYATRHRLCERFASHNPAGVGACRPSPNNQLAAFANGEPIAGQDLVVWYGTSFHHLPRDEDEDHMHPHWSGFSIVPRDLTATNPAG